MFTIRQVTGVGESRKLNNVEANPFSVLEANPFSKRIRVLPQQRCVGEVIAHYLGSTTNGFEIRVKKDPVNSPQADLNCAQQMAENWRGRHGDGFHMTIGPFVRNYTHPNAMVDFLGPYTNILSNWSVPGLEVSIIGRCQEDGKLARSAVQLIESRLGSRVVCAYHVVRLGGRNPVYRL